MRRIFIAPLLASLSLGGCIQMDTLPEVYARSQWKGRSAEEAIAFFGTPQNMQRTADGSQVVMQWYTDTSYSRYEVVGSSLEMQGNVMVNTNYWDTVNHPNRCIINITVDKNKRITQFEADDGEPAAVPRLQWHQVRPAVGRRIAGAETRGPGPQCRARPLRGGSSS